MRGKWVTRDKRVLNISEMETEHIERCIAMLERQIERANFRIGFAETVNGELAREMADEYAMKDLIDNVARGLALADMQQELARRRPSPAP